MTDERQPEWFMPAAWPLWARRSFLLTLPISGLLWLVAYVAFAIVVMAVCFVGIPIMTLVEFWNDLWERQP